MGPSELSRRGFLLGGALAIGGLAAGCGPGDGQSGSSIDTFSAVFQGSGAGEGIDPGTSHQFIDEARLKAIYDGLFEVDDHMVPVPRLATSGEPDASGTKWRLKLREARWHDGKKFTANDVLYTLSRILGPSERKPFIAAKALKNVNLAESRAIDEHTVEIGLHAPSFDFLTSLCAIGTRIVQDGTKDFSKPIGTGPFRFESFEAGKELTASAYHQHWNGAPNIQRLRLLSVEAEARLTALQGGQADYADELTASAVRTLRGTEEITVHTAPNSGVYYFAMKADRPPFDNPDVRRALMRMVNREELVKVALEGQGEIANDIFGRGYQYYADDLPQHRYDPAAAKDFLRKAGMPRLEFDLFTAPVTTGFVEAAKLFAAQAKRIGVRVNVVVGSKETYYSDAMERGALTMGQAGPFPVPNYMAERMLTGAPQNRTKWSDKRFDELYAKAQATRSETARAGIYHQMHEIALDRGGFLYFADQHWSSAAKSKYRQIPRAVPNSLNWARFDKVSL